MKKLDLLLLRGFAAPFITTFFIAMFVLNMQFLWKYIDEIVGKGLEVQLIIELLFYQSLAMMPLALLLAVLIASVMVMGNLAERYELASMKSAGVSLTRTMRPLIVLTTLIAGFSFFCSDNIIPVASLKFKSRLYDIRRQKPTMSLDAGQFNYDFQNFVMHIKSKDAQKNILNDLKVYDHTSGRGNVSQVNAAKGEAYYSIDKRYLILKMHDGERYEEIQNNNDLRSNNYPVMRMKFKEYQSMFDLAQFDMSKTDEELFKNHYSLLSSRQLYESLDSLYRREIDIVSRLKINADPVYAFARKSTIEQLIRNQNKNRDSIRTYTPAQALLDMQGAKIKAEKPYLETIARTDRDKIINTALSSTRNLSSYAEQSIVELHEHRVEKAKHLNEIHRKFSLAVACIIFLFIGAPMGAIIRKGGFGWPILIAIIFFTIFFVASITGEKLSKNLSLPPYIGMWLANIVLLPLGVFLTDRAMRDSALFNPDAYAAFFNKLFKRVGLVPK